MCWVILAEIHQPNGILGNFLYIYFVERYYTKVILYSKIQYVVQTSGLQYVVLKHQERCWGLLDVNALK